MPLLLTDPVDLALDADGDLDVGADLSFTSGLAAVAQGIRARVELVRGEWFLDLDAGVPYYEDILGRPFDQLKVNAAFREAILDAPGVAALESLTCEFDGATRSLDVRWVARTVFGDTVEDSLSQEI